MIDLLVTVLVAFVSGGLASVLTTWAQWGVTKRSERLKHRRELIQTWRAGLVRWDPAGEPDLYDTDWFVSLEGHLAPFVLTKAARTMVVTAVGSRDGQKAALQREIDRIEREWGLA